jgi:hypothetical protein
MLYLDWSSFFQITIDETKLTAPEKCSTDPKARTERLHNP